MNFDIRICKSCGLRYPLMNGHSFGVRCPKCMGETFTVMAHEIGAEDDSAAREIPQADCAVLLDNIRSAWNVGSIFRSADGFGFSRLYLCGITPTPELDAVRKTSLGAEEFVSWSYHVDAVKLAQNLKQDGWKIFALEEENRARPISQVESFSRAVLIVGNEVSGVDPELRDLADEILYIPMRGQKRSFNVANAFSVAAYALVENKK